MEYQSQQAVVGKMQGDMLCCETCPATFHMECVGLTALPDGDWWCPQCVCAVCGQAHFESRPLPATAKQVRSSALTSLHTTTQQREGVKTVMQTPVQLITVINLAECPCSFFPPELFRKDTCLTCLL